MNELLSAISTVGFPIAACIALFYSNQKSEERHKEEMSKLDSAIDNNTIAITKLVTIIEKRGDNNV